MKFHSRFRSTRNLNCNNYRCRILTQLSDSRLTFLYFYWIYEIVSFVERIELETTQKHCPDYIKCSSIPDTSRTEKTDISVSRCGSFWARVDIYARDVINLEMKVVNVSEDVDIKQSYSWEAACLVLIRLYSLLRSELLTKWHRQPQPTIGL